MKEEGHNYTFHIPWVPWHEKLPYDVNTVTPDEAESKPYLEEVRELLMHIMSYRHNPKDVWECASEALRIIDMEGQDERFTV